MIEPVTDEINVSATCHIFFFAPIDKESIDALMGVVMQYFNSGYRKFSLLLSSTGGDIYYAITAYNFLRGLPIELTTHNFGQVESSAVTLFCAGSNRLATNRARFQIHDTFVELNHPTTLETPLLQQIAAETEASREQIAQIYATATGHDPSIISKQLIATRVFNAIEAVDYGFVHQITDDLLLDEKPLVLITKDYGPGLKVVDAQGDVEEYSHGHS